MPIFNILIISNSLTHMTSALRLRQWLWQSESEMGSCSSCWLTDIRDNKVKPDNIHVRSKVKDQDRWDDSMDSDLYLERVTHIVADIHERVRHKHKTKDRDTKDDAPPPPDIVTISSADMSSNHGSQSSSMISSSTNSQKKSNLSIPSIINSSSSNSLLP